jgi:hypothetical protein
MVRRAGAGRLALVPCLARGDSGTLHLNECYRIAEPSQRRPHLRRRRIRDATALRIDTGSRPVDQRLAVTWLKPRFGGKRQPVEVVADELLGGPIHASMIHL